MSVNLITGGRDLSPGRTAEAEQEPGFSSPILFSLKPRKKRNVYYRNINHEINIHIGGLDT